MSKFPGIRDKVLKRDFRNRDKILKELYDILNIVYQGVNMPCSTVTIIQFVIHQVFHLSSNLSKDFKSRAHLSMKWVDPTNQPNNTE